MGENEAKTTKILDKEQCHADSGFGKKAPPIDITRKCEKLCTVAFNRKFNYDDVIKMKNKCHISCRELSPLQHIEIWEKIAHRSAR